MKRIIIAAFAAYLTSAIALAVTITLTPSQLGDIAAQQGGSPPVTPPVTPPQQVTCSDGSVHPAGYVCPVAPPTNDPEVTHVCPGYAKTIWMAANWAAPTRMLTGSYGGMGANDIVVYRFTTAGPSPSSNNFPRIAGAEYGGGGANRVFNLSEKPCDFDPPYLAFASHGEGTPTVPFLVVTPDPWGFYPVLQGNKTYYLNVKAAAGSGCTTSCDMFFDLSKNGTP